MASFFSFAKLMDLLDKAQKGRKEGRGDEKMEKKVLLKELADVLNRNSAENASNTPDFILAKYLIFCLNAFNETIKLREAWYGEKEYKAKKEVNNNV